MCVCVCVSVVGVWGEGGVSLLGDYLFCIPFATYLVKVNVEINIIYNIFYFFFFSKSPPIDMKAW